MVPSKENNMTSLIFGLLGILVAPMAMIIWSFGFAGVPAAVGYMHEQVEKRQLKRKLAGRKPRPWRFYGPPAVVGGTVFWLSGQMLVSLAAMAWTVTLMFMYVAYVIIQHYPDDLP